MGVMCSAFTRGGRGLVTFDIGVGPGGRPIYGIAWWTGRKWKYNKYSDFREARRTFNMIRTS